VNNPPVEHLDVLIVGAGLSGIGAAVHLQNEAPTKKFAIIEGRDNLGGTWDLFRYPGIRSDSDMYTLGYGFKPWTKERAIASGESILDYLWETVSENDLKCHIKFGHQVRRAEWSSESSLWTVQLDHLGETLTITVSYRISRDANVSRGPSSIPSTGLPISTTPTRTWSWSDRARLPSR
jgi:monooxygenase